ncbi:MAG: hypothetical protein AAF654_08390 [Myxococcota bacterium]
MGGDDLVFLDLQTLQNLKGDTPTPDEALAMETQAVPALAHFIETDETIADETQPDVRASVHAETPCESEPEPKTSLPKTFSLKPDDGQNEWTVPKGHYSGAGVYSMPVRVDGDGQFVRGRDYQRWYDPSERRKEYQTGDFDLANVERDLRRRRNGDS